MSKFINVNADVAEGYGAFTIGDGAALMKIVRSANVACGFHAGDPSKMHNLITLARQEGVSIGAHVGFNDLWGFGRREIRMSAVELEYMIAYQIGALQALAAYGDLPVTHVKAHGALYNMAAANSDYAMAIGRAIKTVAPELIYVGFPRSEMQRAAEKLALRFAREGFCDRRYTDNGDLVSRAIPDSVVRDAGEACEQSLRLVLHGEVVSMSGKTIKLEVDTLCVHGDETTAVAVACQVKKVLQDGGVQMVTLPELIA
jgi:5-oxoprolinase (ATP-hydrolysing) subunit A